MEVGIHLGSNDHNVDEGGYLSRLCIKIMVMCMCISHCLIGSHGEFMQEGFD